MRYLFYFVLFCTVSISCSREVMDPQTGSLAVRFDNVVGGADLNLNGTTYTNSSGEPYTISALNYFVSNIRLRKVDGSEYVVPQDSSYFLVRESDATSQTIRLNNVPLAQYTGLSFLVGVDSLRSVSGVDKRTGVLDPGTGSPMAGMAWDWNTGYIFLKLEGNSPVVNPDATGNRNYRFHIGLFGRNGTPNNLRRVSIAFDGASVTPDNPARSLVTIRANVQTIFAGRTRLSLAQSPNIMIAPKSSEVADNYAGMFSFGNLTTGPQ